MISLRVAVCQRNGLGETLATLQVFWATYLGIVVARCRRYGLVHAYRVGRGELFGRRFLALGINLAGHQQWAFKVISLSCRKDDLALIATL